MASRSFRMTAADYMRILFRRKWYVIIPMAISCGIAATFAWVVLENLYESYARIHLVENSAKKLEPGDTNDIPKSIGLLSEKLRDDDFLRLLVFYLGYHYEEDVKNTEGKTRLKPVIWKIDALDKQIKDGEAVVFDASYIKVSEDSLFPKKEIIDPEAELKKRIDESKIAPEIKQNVYFEDGFYVVENVTKFYSKNIPTSGTPTYLINTNTSRIKFKLNPEDADYVKSEIRNIRKDIELESVGGDVILIKGVSAEKNKIRRIVDAVVSLLESNFNRFKVGEAENSLNFQLEVAKNMQDRSNKAKAELEAFKTNKGIHTVSRVTKRVDSRGEIVDSPLEKTEPYLGIAQQITDVRINVDKAKEILVRTIQDKDFYKERIIDHYLTWSSKGRSSSKKNNDNDTEILSPNVRVGNTNVRGELLMKKVDLEVELGRQRKSGKSDEHPVVKNIIAEINAITDKLNFVLEMEKAEAEKLKKKEDQPKPEDEDSDKDYAMIMQKVKEEAANTPDEYIDKKYKSIRSDERGNVLLENFMNKLMLIRQQKLLLEDYNSKFYSLMSIYSGLKYEPRKAGESDSDWERRMDDWVSIAGKKGAEKMESSIGVYRNKERDIAELDISISQQKLKVERAANILKLASEKFLKFEIIQAPLEPVMPIYPKKHFIMLVGVLIGLLTAVGGIFLAEYADHSIRSEEEAERYLELPVIGIIPEFDFQRKEAFHIRIRNMFFFWRKGRERVTGQASLSAVYDKRKYKIEILIVLALIIVLFVVGIKYWGLLEYLKDLLRG